MSYNLMSLFGLAVLILILSLSVGLFFKSKFGPSTLNCCILLTTTVFINTEDYKNDYNSPESRLKLYLESIDDWLNNTNLTIYIVESSNYSFPEYKNNPRVKIYTFETDNIIDCKECSATPYEAESILKAYNHFNLGRYDKIIKVTGKYFIPNMEDLIKNIPSDADLFLQNSIDHDLKRQNSEMFGCKTKHLTDIMNKIIKNSKRNLNFESTLYKIIFDYKITNDYKFYRFPPIQLTRGVRRSGDNQIMYVL